MYLVLFATLLTVASTARHQKETSPSRIINGDDVLGPGDYPWQCSLQWRGSHTCGCAVIGPQSVVTAAHCLWNNSTRHYRILAGTHDVLRLKQGRPVFLYVSEYHIHPKFEMNSAKGFPNDIGVVKLTSPIDMTNPFIKTIKMYQGSESFGGHRCNITGWGLDERHVMPDILQYAMVDVYNNTWCKNNMYPSISDGHVCVGDAGISGSCNGDSGGPLSCDHNEEKVLVGITSFGTWGCDTNKPSVYTRVSHYRTWVREVTGI